MVCMLEIAFNYLVIIEMGFILSVILTAKLKKGFKIGFETIVDDVLSKYTTKLHKNF